jgi:hypothetical protein
VVLGEKADLGARNVTEGRSRLLSAVISGGMILDSSRLADDAQGQELAQAVYDNKALFAVAAEGRIFRPVEGDTGDKAANVFARRSANGYYVALFNLDDKQKLTVQVPVERIAPEWAAKEVAVTDVAAKTALPSAGKILSVELEPAESKLIEIRHE